MLNKLDNIFQKIYTNEIENSLFECETIFYLTTDVLKRNLYGDKILEVGCGIGLSTQLLLEYTNELSVVDASHESIMFTKQKLSNSGLDINKIKFYESLWEEFDIQEKFTDIVFFRGAEHIKNPELVINNLKKMLINGGRLHISVPNANSFHRKIGVHMNILQNPKSFTESDIKVGHENVFDFYSMRDLLINKCNMSVYSHQGVFIKFLSNSQMNVLFKQNKNLSLALYELGKEYPTESAEIYFCVKNKD